MKPKIIVAGFNRMAALARSVLKEMQIPPGIDVETTEILPQNLLNSPVRKYSFPNHAPCVLISGNGSSQLLKEKFNFPVIPIKITGFDLMQSLLEASQYDCYVPVVNFICSMPEIEKNQDILKVQVREYVYSTREDAHALFKKLEKEGCKVIVGASLACDLAEEYGMKGIFFYTPSALQQALEYAVDMINAYLRESERVETFKAIVDFTHSGIIGTDRNFRITTFNPASEKILGLKSEKVMDRDFFEVFPEFQVIHKDGEVSPTINSLGRYGQNMVVFSSLPIMVDGQSYGQVTVLQDTTSIQMAEEKIRQAIHSRQFTAQHTFSNIVGKNPSFRSVVDKARKYGRTGSAVLITGKSGTGKELFAQSIHNISYRGGKPFVAVNCAALPESLLDSELFGYEQGAFTGALKGGKPGLFEMAHTGTIFLDEASEISPSVQARLLRVLQEKEVMRIGGDRLIPVDVRVISATNRNLWELVQLEKFREDLYYRLCVLELQIPPLRDRKDDIPLLIQALLQRISPQVYHSSRQLVLKAFGDLKDHSWPGNVRELENILERFVALASDISPDLNSYRLILKDCFRNRPSTTRSVARTNVVGLKRNVSKTEQNEIQRVLKKMGGNKTQAANALGISRSTLYRKFKKISP